MSRVDSSKNYIVRLVTWLEAGAGIYGPSTKYALSLGICMSVFHAEKERNYQKCDIAIHSDSQATIKALSSYAIDSKMIWECRNKLNEFGKKNKVL